MHILIIPGVTMPKVEDSVMARIRQNAGPDAKITLVKNTALVSTIAISELLRAGTDFMVWKANTFSPFAGVALGYLLLTLPLIGLNAWLERRYAVN